MTSESELRVVARAFGERLAAMQRDVSGRLHVLPSAETVTEQIRAAEERIAKSIASLLEGKADRTELELIADTVNDHADRLAGVPDMLVDEAREAVDESAMNPESPLAKSLAAAAAASAVQGERGETGAGLDAPAWEPGVYRDGCTVTHHIGQYFRALVDTAQEPGTGEDWQRLGTAGFRLAEPYTEGRSYAPGDLFVRDRALFLQTGKSGPRLMVGRGAKGEPGTPGTPGRPGRDGATVETIELRGTALVLGVIRDGQPDPLTVDLAPLVDHVAASLQATLADELKALRRMVEVLEARTATGGK